MKIGNIEFAHDFIRVWAALTGSVLVAMAISMSMAACSLFEGSAVREKVVQHPAAKTVDPYQIGSDDELEIQLLSRAPMDSF